MLESRPLDFFDAYLLMLLGLHWAGHLDASEWLGGLLAAAGFLFLRHVRYGALLR